MLSAGHAELDSAWPFSFSSQSRSVAADSRYHAILGAGPSYIVHPSNLATPLVALDAKIKIAGPAGEKTMPRWKISLSCRKSITGGKIFSDRRRS